MRPGRAILLTILAAAACGDPTGPSGLTGTWEYSATNLATEALPQLVCSIARMTLTVTQTGKSLSGSATGGTITCLGQPMKVLPSPRSVTGSVDDSVITVEIGQEIFNIGVLDGDVVSGTSIERGFSLGLVLVGRFTLVRQ